MLRSLVGENVDLVVTMAEELGLVKVDPGQLEQVTVNLLVNARESMPRGGRVVIATANAELDESYSRQRAPVRPGPYVVLTVCDTGCGMDPETLSHLFEPFFTTKELGHGTGLGLSTVYGIVEQCGGTIWVDSMPGRGTTFEVYFPRAAAPAEHEAPSLPPFAPTGSLETVLVVEDEPALRAIVQEILEMSGYRVIEAAGGSEALAASSAHNGEIDLMITDVVMPGMSGRELAEEMSRRRPKMKVLYTSGHTDDAMIHHGVLEKGIPFLQKPFNLESLIDKVRDVLDAP
jgi:two-component system cell cycle sensor histidine kinase/response regulator CckA